MLDSPRESGNSSLRIKIGFKSSLCCCGDLLLLETNEVANVEFS